MSHVVCAKCSEFIEDRGVVRDRKPYHEGCDPSPSASEAEGRVVCAGCGGADFGNDPIISCPGNVVYHVRCWPGGVSTRSSPAAGEWPSEEQIERAACVLAQMFGYSGATGFRPEARRILSAAAPSPGPARDDPDWPPQVTAIGRAEGEQRHGSTGQLWEVRNHQWARVPSPGPAQMREIVKDLVAWADGDPGTNAQDMEAILPIIKRAKAALGLDRKGLQHPKDLPERDPIRGQHD